MSNSLKRAAKDKQSELDNLVKKRCIEEKKQVLRRETWYAWYLLAWEIDMIKIWSEPQKFAFPNLGNVICFFKYF